MKPTLCFAKLALLGHTMMKPGTYQKAKKMGWIDLIEVEDGLHYAIALDEKHTQIPEIRPRDILKRDIKDKRVGDRITSEHLGTGFIFNGTFWVEE